MGTMLVITIITLYSICHICVIARSDPADYIRLSDYSTDHCNGSLCNVFVLNHNILIVHLGFVNMIRRFLTTKTVLIALVVGCGLQLFQQFGGINTVMYV